MKSTWWICNVCASGVCNDDWTALDYYYTRDAAEHELELRTARLAELHNLTWQQRTRPSVSDRDVCHVCNHIPDGDLHKFTAD